MTGRLGHNIADLTIEVEVRLFNSLTRYAGAEGPRRKLRLPAGTTVGELADRLAVPRAQLFLVLINGRDITPGLVGAEVRCGQMMEDGDVVAFSGAVPCGSSCSA